MNQANCGNYAENVRCHHTKLVTSSEVGYIGLLFYYLGEIMIRNPDAFSIADEISTTYLVLKHTNFLE